MTSEDTSAALRRRTQAHYDRHPFGFDQEEILQEKLERRVMGEAIRALRDPGALVVDVGCGACRVARLVQRATRARTASVDLSLASLRDARRHAPGPLVNGDNLRLPLRTACADLVVSNGVIHHTPDARASFMELARVTRPGGTLVVSVYNRHCWYYYTYRYLGAVVRGLRRVIGDRGLRVTLFPFFHVGVVMLLSVATRKKFLVPRATTWNLFHDQFTTPQCTFHTFEELRRWATEAGLVCEEARKEAANQLATVRLRKPGGACA
jgi:SAM-dependent methyltransferase